MKKIKVKFKRYRNKQDYGEMTIDTMGNQFFNFNKKFRVGEHYFRILADGEKTFFRFEYNLFILYLCGERSTHYSCTRIIKNKKDFKLIMYALKKLKEL